jgi:membrane protein DedA with SNARE-associated domain
MAKFSKILGIVISSLFILFGVYLFSNPPRFAYLSHEVRIIFAIFLLVYGAWRLVRYIMKDRSKDEE